MTTQTPAWEREMYTPMYKTLALEDAAGFERSALQAAAVAGAAFLCAGAVAGKALLDPRAALLLAPLLALFGAGTALLLGAQRRARALEAGEPVPARRLLLASVVLAALAGVFAARALPQLWSALVTLSEALPLLSLFPLLLRSAPGGAAVQAGPRWPATTGGARLRGAPGRGAGAASPPRELGRRR